MIRLPGHRREGEKSEAIAIDASSMMPHVCAVRGRRGSDRGPPGGPMAPASPVRHGRQTAADGPLCSAAANHALIPGGRSCGYAFGTSQSSPVSPDALHCSASEDGVEDTLRSPVFPSLRLSSYCG
ncbi:hypothetical protein MRX96_033368 [Rhipicephalus microplus]